MTRTDSRHGWLDDYLPWVQGSEMGRQTLSIAITWPNIDFALRTKRDWLISKTYALKLHCCSATPRRAEDNGGNELRLPDRTGLRSQLHGVPFTASFHHQMDYQQQTGKYEQHCSGRVFFPSALSTCATQTWLPRRLISLWATLITRNRASRSFVRDA